MTDRGIGQISTDVYGTLMPQVDIGCVSFSAAQAVAADTDAVKADIPCSGSESTVVNTGIEALPCARNITATAAASTAADIKAVQVIIEGKNLAGETITESLPAFTNDTPGTVTGSKAFASVTKITIPAMDGASVLVDIGFGDKLGLPLKMAQNTVLAAYLNNAKEGTAPTVAVSSSALESNTVDLNSSLDGHPVDVYLMV